MEPISLIDNLLVYGLVLLLVALSWPTIMQLATLLREDTNLNYQSDKKFQLTTITKLS